MLVSEDGEGDDIIEEALKYFRANVFFKNFDIKVRIFVFWFFMNFYDNVLLP